jgi:hypothetical protein
MKADQAIGRKQMLFDMRRVQPRHQRKYSDRKNYRRGKRAQKSESWPQTQHHIRSHNRPIEKAHRLVKIVDGAFLQRKPAHEHGLGLQSETSQQNAVIDMVMGAEALAPKEQRIDRACAVTNYSQQKEMSVSPRKHFYNDNWPRNVRKDEFRGDFTPTEQRTQKEGGSGMMPKEVREVTLFRPVVFPSPLQESKNSIEKVRAVGGQSPCRRDSANDKAGTHRQHR